MSGVLTNVIPDVRYGIRILAGSPAFALIATLALALGIGANTAVFSAIDAVLLRPLPYKDPPRTAMIWEDVSAAGFPRNTPAPANYVDWKNQNQVFSSMAALRGNFMNLTGDGPPEHVVGSRLTPEFFGVMGIAPLIGRALDEKGERSVDNVIVISYSLWQRRYGGDRGVVGRTIRCNGRAEHDRWRHASGLSVSVP